MIVEEHDTKFLSYRERSLKIYTCEELCQLAFDFKPYYNSYSPPIVKECHSVYRKEDGSLIVRKTKHRPIQDSEHWCSPGYVNGYGHKMVDYYEQYKFDF